METQTWACPPQPCDPRPGPAEQPPPPWTARSSSPGRCPCCWTLLGSPRPPHSSQRAPSAWLRALPWCRRGCWQTQWLYPCCCRGTLWGCPCGWWMPFPLGLLGHLVFHFSQRARSPLPCPLQGELHHPLPCASCWAALIDGIESLVRKNYPVFLPHWNSSALHSRCGAWKLHMEPQIQWQVLKTPNKNLPQGFKEQITTDCSTKTALDESNWNICSFFQPVTTDSCWFMFFFLCLMVLFFKKKKK